MNVLLDHLKDKYNLTNSEIFEQLSAENEKSIETPDSNHAPISIFNSSLGALESIVKYLKEDKNLSNKNISLLLNRDQRTIWATYNKAKNKHTQKLDTSSKLKIPLSIFTSRKLSILESLVLYLKTELSLPLHEIAESLCRDDSTIWTVFSRAKKKNEIE